ncbi:HAD-like protein [Exidia glandulosa HHB12029]|uniref:HAD-like protein n=1 Tax=Exidia glandulosa HHB12029 TaxID=1314781 RepID=A0A165JSN3_EXIGL|nr:HAD-like protein [Exidia glandulosa HHB12029]
MTTPPAELAPVKALVFDIIGTTTDWFTYVHAAVKAVDSTIDADELVKAWRKGFAQRTRASTAAGTFVEMYATYGEVLDELCRERGLEWAEDVKRDLVKSWGRMKAWDDTAHGLELLRSKYVVCGLSNGRASMMIDVHKKNNMTFDLLLTSDVIHAYKPASKMYQAALSALNLQPGEVAMVAAHAYDLRAAREQYVVC